MRLCDQKGRSRLPMLYSWPAPRTRMWTYSSPMTNGSRAGTSTASSSSCHLQECLSEFCRGVPAFGASRLEPLPSGKYDPGLSLVLLTQITGGAPLLALFEQWPAERSCRWDQFEDYGDFSKAVAQFRSKMLD